MIRKQIFVRDSQNKALKRLAHRTGKAEGQLIREAVDRILLEEAETEKLWNALLQRWAGEPETAQPGQWKREDLYRDRVGKFDADPR